MHGKGAFSKVKEFQVLLFRKLANPHSALLSHNRTQRRRQYWALPMELYWSPVPRTMSHFSVSTCSLGSASEKAKTTTSFSKNSGLPRADRAWWTSSWLEQTLLALSYLWTTHISYRTKALSRVTWIQIQKANLLKEIHVMRPQDVRIPWGASDFIEIQLIS